MGTWGRFNCRNKSLGIAPSTSAYTLASWHRTQPLPDRWARSEIVLKEAFGYVQLDNRQWPEPQCC